MSVRRVIQKDATGCGIACAAMIADVSYKRARKAAIEIEIVADAPPHYTNSSEIGRLLTQLGASAERGRKLSHWSSLSCLSIVGINYNEKFDTWHWVVYVPSSNGGYVLDPRATVKAKRRFDFARMRPSRYIPVARPNNSFKPTPLRGAA